MYRRHTHLFSICLILNVVDTSVTMGGWLRPPVKRSHVSSTDTNSANVSSVSARSECSSESENQVMLGYIKLKMHLQELLYTFFPYNVTAENQVKTSFSGYHLNTIRALFTF